MEIAIASGVEMMSVEKMGSDAAPGMFDGKTSEFAQKFPYKLLHQGVSAELVAQKYNVTREECDAFAAESHKRAANAQKKGYWKSQILPVPVSVKDKNGQVQKSTFEID